MQPRMRFGTDRQSLAEIEYEVRRMRAEMLRAGAAAVRRALVRLFTRREAAGTTAEA